MKQLLIIFIKLIKYYLCNPLIFNFLFLYYNYNYYIHLYFYFYFYFYYFFDYLHNYGYNYNYITCFFHEDPNFYLKF
jgi:hypothetical protein